MVIISQYRRDIYTLVVLVGPMHHGVRVHPQNSGEMHQQAVNEVRLGALGPKSWLTADGSGPGVPPSSVLETPECFGRCFHLI
jgi:hypothetical protein